MDKKIYDTYSALLNSELKMATGCTEPIAIAYAGARLRQVLGEIPEHCTVYCSGNIVKNVFAVTVPNSGGAKGIDTAALLGIIGGDADSVLDVLHAVTPEDIELMNKLVADKICDCELVEGVENLYVRIEAKAGENTALVEIKDYHSNITRIEKNGEVLLNADEEGSETSHVDKTLLNVRDIMEYANTVDLNDIKDVLLNQIKCNSAIAEEGLKNPWGSQVGRTIYEHDLGKSVWNKARAYAAAGSDARMNGCPMPVVINSGSGNQGMTVSLPIYVYAQDMGVSEELMLRALALANLISLHQKRYIGSLSAYCGAVSAATGAACGIAYMQGGDYKLICDVITNSINTTGGMVCDGAKSSCAAKIATALDMALLSYEMSKKNRAFMPGEGLVEDNIEETIANVGRMGRDGMKSTDVEILKIMLGK
ncbi:MAG: serine dehydratase subunit alpha family protein [Oscillospiraceae bacterium]|nr:serine dehydratase subunit alpha family protein [Oscillospiraceae bacterium]